MGKSHVLVSQGGPSQFLDADYEQGLVGSGYILELFITRVPFGLKWDWVTRGFSELPTHPAPVLSCPVVTWLSSRRRVEVCRSSLIYYQTSPSGSRIPKCWAVSRCCWNRGRRVSPVGSSRRLCVLLILGKRRCSPPPGVAAPGAALRRGVGKGRVLAL